MVGGTPGRTWKMQREVEGSRRGGGLGHVCRLVGHGPGTPEQAGKTHASGWGWAQGMLCQAAQLVICKRSTAFSLAWLSTRGQGVCQILPLPF